MNGIVALGDRALAHVALEYGRQHRSAIYVLGERNSTDIRLHALEDLLEPFMDGYFTGEATLRARTIINVVRARSEICGPLEIGEVLTATAGVLARSLAPCLSLIEMLDRANALHPVELVAAGPENPRIAATAVAWAKARGIPTIMFDSATLHGPRDVGAGGIVAFGRRGRVAYEAATRSDVQFTALPHPKFGPTALIAGHRTAYRERVATAQGWPTGDTLVAFEPEQPTSQTGGAGRTFEDSVREMVAAFAFARERVASLRLVVLPSASVADGKALLTGVAQMLGVLPHDVFYAEAETDIWIGIADIVVSHESFRSIEAAAAGAAAVNLWRPATWRDGPAFGAHDGIIEATPQTLGPTLVALAQNAALRRQVAAIAAAKIGEFGMTAAAPDAPDNVVRVAEHFLRSRAPKAPAVHIKRTLDIVVNAPPYTHASAGVRALYRLCHFINLLGGNASIFPGTLPHPTWNTPRRAKNLTERSIVIYPEVADASLPAKRVVRWVLNVPGLLSGPKRYADTEMVFYHAGFREAAQAATSEPLGEERELSICTIEPELFYFDRSKPRVYDCVYIGKGEERFARVQPPEMRNALVIRRYENAWPASRADTAALLRGCNKLYVYDQHTAIFEEAVLCGVTIVMVGPHGDLLEFPAPSREAPKNESDAIEAAGFADLARRSVEAYYDTSQVERFLRLVTERWD